MNVNQAEEINDWAQQSESRIFPLHKEAMRKFKTSWDQSLWLSSVSMFMKIRFMMIAAELIYKSGLFLAPILWTTWGCLAYATWGNNHVQGLIVTFCYSWDGHIVSV